MPRLILKSPYLKPNAKQHLVNYTQYVATREGVERPEAAAGKTQRKVIAELLKEYPDIRELYESEDYRLNPTQGNADEFILRAAEMHGELFGTRQRYVDYIANRPGAASWRPTVCSRMMERRRRCRKSRIIQVTYGRISCLSVGKTPPGWDMNRWSSGRRCCACTATPSPGT